MRTIIILGSVLALIGLASTAQASDWHRGGDRGTQMHRESHADHERHERHEYRNRSRRHHEAEEHRHGSRERHHESHERSEHR